MGLSAVTVLGIDRPGVISEVSGAIAEQGANIQDSTMTLLGDYVVMTLLVSGTLAAEKLRDHCPDLVITTVEMDGLRDPAPSPRAWFRPFARTSPGEADDGVGFVLSVHGADRPGIISAVSGVLACERGTITGMNSRLSGDLYVLIADVRIPGDVDVAALMRRLAAVGAGLGAEITFRPAVPELL
ncbi:ACT domain-containing protein [Streptosporangium soli]|nr:glycine cleavage system transcriptional repressor [Streptosporangium sp. KLBMP 9127]